jgi:hypothetical protein
MFEGRHVRQNISACVDGRTRTLQACADGEQGPPLARAEILRNNSAHANGGPRSGLCAPRPPGPARVHADLHISI